MNAATMKLFMTLRLFSGGYYCTAIITRLPLSNAGFYRYFTVLRKGERDQMRIACFHSFTDIRDCDIQGFRTPVICSFYFQRDRQTLRSHIGRRVKQQITGWRSFGI